MDNVHRPMNSAPEGGETGFQRGEGIPKGGSISRLFQLTFPIRTLVTIDHHIFRHIYLSRSLKNFFVSKYHQLLKSKISVYLQSYYYTSHDAFQKKSKKKLRICPL